MKTFKKILALVMVSALCLAFTACGDPETVDDNAVKTEGAISVECKETKVVKDADGKDAVMLKIHFKNDTSKDQLFKPAVSVVASQNGEELASAIVTADVDPAQANVDKKLAKGEEQDVAVFFVLKDTTTPVKVRMTPKSGTDKTAKETEMTIAG